jgi:polysaccharide deacetylase 2 family uncharacterized protein YibQ
METRRDQNKNENEIKKKINKAIRTAKQEGAAVDW